MAHKYKYCVMFAYLCTSVNEVKFEYVENIACNKAEAISLAIATCHNLVMYRD